MTTSEKIIFIHIGYFKTGTTALQDFFHGNEEELLQLGILYPKTFRVLNQNNHSLLALCLAESEGIHTPWWAQTKINQQNDKCSLENSLLELKAEIENSKANKVFISTEEFINLGQEKAIPLLESLKTLFSPFEVRIICAVRRQDEYIEAFHNFLIKCQRPRPPIQDEINFFTQHFHNYKNCLSTWAKVFGDNAITLLTYPQGNQDKSTFIPELLNEIHPNIPKHLIKKIKSKNTALNNNYIEALREINNKYQGDSKKITHYHDAAKRLSIGNKRKDRLIEPDLQKEILDKNKDINKWISNRFYSGKPLFDNSIENNYIKRNQIDQYKREIITEVKRKKKKELIHTFALKIAKLLQKYTPKK